MSDDNHSRDEHNDTDRSHEVSHANCVFCGIISGTEPATIVRAWPDALAFVPLGPVIPDGGHILVVPRQHVADAVENPAVTAATMARAAELAAEHEASNILTSVGAAATQSIFHLHVHVVRRAVGDQLMVPWGTTGNPHDPHSCKRSTKAETELAKLRAQLAAANARAETAEARVAHLDKARDAAVREWKREHDAADALQTENAKLRAQLDALGEEWGYRFGQGGGEDGFDSEATARLIAAPGDRIVRRLATDWEVVGEPVAPAPDATANGHSATQTSAQT